MPIWEYRCTKCDELFERIVWRDSEKVDCPGCGHQEVEKLLPTFTVGKWGRQGRGRRGAVSLRSTAPRYV